ncbi:substrate-binding domain-containing protein, partial [Escherichia coli]|nr:substrate-binding domain-containing protein [Escherichia coli]
KVPDDLSIIGDDDIHIAEFMSPSLTTIHQPKYRLGQAAVETLVRRLDDKSNDAQVVKLEPTLVVRNSMTNFS